MDKSKGTIPKGHDRLSELPNSIIFHILWFVPMRDVVKTTVLSKRWKDLWTTSPFLYFDKEYIKKENSDRDRDRENSSDEEREENIPSEEIDVFVESVNRALLRWNGNKILKFIVDGYYEKIDKELYGYIELWVNFAKARGVEDFYLFMEEDRARLDQRDPYMVPPCLYSCSSLKLLSFHACHFKLYGDVQWNQLENLTITDGFGVTEHVVNQILSGSPRLEILSLSFVDRGENLNIRSSSLKELSIRKYLYISSDHSFVSELTIWTPNLEKLTIEGMPYGSCQLMNVSSLTSATIGFHGLLYRNNVGCNLYGDYIENGFASGQDYIGDKCSQILQTIQHVKSITLTHCCLKVLIAMKTRCMHSSFHNVKSLEIDCFRDNSEELVGLLESFPQLGSLVLHAKTSGYCPQDPKAVECKANIPRSFLPRLRRIEVIWSYGDSIFALIEILLKYASKLEKMVFRVENLKSPDSLLSVSKKLLNMPRSSTNCTINFLNKKS